MLLFEHISKVTQLKVQSKVRYLLLKKLIYEDYNKLLVGTTQHYSRVSDITDPKMYTNPAPGNVIYRLS